MTKLILSMITVAAAIASAASTTCRFDLSSPAWVGSTELKPGAYKVEVEGDKAVFQKGGKNVVEVPAKLEEGGQKHSNTALMTINQNGKPMLQEIQVGGTLTTIVFSTGSGAAK